MWAEMSQGFDFCFCLAIEASASATGVTDFQVGSLGQSSFAADIKGEFNRLGDDSGKGADLQGDAENLCGLFACGIFDCQVDNILCEAEFVQRIMSKSHTVRESRTVLINIMKGSLKKQGNSEQRFEMKQFVWQ
jgi:hypothetical protein